MLHVLVHLVPIIGFARVLVALGTFAQWRHDLEPRQGAKPDVRNQ